MDNVQQKDNPNLNVDDIAFSFHPTWSKDKLIEGIDKFGRKEMVYRLAWLLDGSEKQIDKLIDDFLTDNYVDDTGVKGGRDFWGDL